VCKRGIIAIAAMLASALWGAPLLGQDPGDGAPTGTEMASLAPAAQGSEKFAGTTAADVGQIRRSEAPSPGSGARPAPDAGATPEQWSGAAATATAPASDGASGGGAASAHPTESEIYSRRIERKKLIHSIFSKLREQVEVLEKAQSAALVPLPEDLPPEALDVDEEQVPGTRTGSVLDEPGAGASGRKTKSTRPGRSRGRTKIGGGEGNEVARDPGGEAGGTYTVQKGDTLGRIAAKLLGSSRKATVIAKANGMAITDPLMVGRQLVVPGAGALDEANLGDVEVQRAEVAGKRARSAAQQAGKGASRPSRTARKPKNPESEAVLDYTNYDFTMYAVKPGDTLGSVSNVFYGGGGGKDLIRKYNKLGPGDAELKAGERILIPVPKPPSKQKATDERVEKAKKKSVF
jgi:nucleoid-associated protein YgaU